MNEMGVRQEKKGQSIVELALILPFIILLMIATVEAGFVLRDYLMVQSVNREGVRWAARTPPTHGEEGRLEDFQEQVGEVFDRILSAAQDGGLRQEDVGIIVTHIYITSDGAPPADPPYPYVFQRPASFEMASNLNVPALWADNQAQADQINSIRTSGVYEALDNELVIVEVFYRHETLWGFDIVGPFGEDFVMYAQSSMRLIGTGR
jgi:hypothetical protein